jgi:vacuolar-type H+-ATPase subunit H
MAEENPGVTEEIKNEPHRKERVEQFIDEEGEKIRQETDRVQSPLIAKARQEYKKRLITFLEEEREKIRSEAERDAAEKRNNAESEANTIIAQAQAKTQEIIAAARIEALTQAEQVIDEAKRQANITRERAVAEGRKEADVIITEAKQNADRFNSEATEAARKITEAECARIVTEAHESASGQAATIISNSWRQAQDMLDAAEVAYNVVREQLRQCYVAISEADRRMAIALTGRESKREESNVEPAVK